MPDSIDDSQTDDPARDTLREVARLLGDGGVVLVPTETVYGLAALPGRPEAIQRIYDLKGRPDGVKLPVVIGDVEQVAGLGVAFDDDARRLARALWPGPLTIVVGFDDEAERPDWLAGRIEVALRLPDHDLLRSLALASGPFLLTSANRHGDGAKSTSEEALESLHGTPDLVLDEGRLSPRPSTIVNTRVRPPQIERLGAIDAERIEAVLREAD